MPDSQPLRLSIVLPVFNEASTILECLGRVIRAPLLPGMQRELVIVESQSTDGTRDRVVGFVDELKAAGWSTARGAEPYADQTWKEGTSRVRLMLQDSPRGKGNAVRLALPYLTGDVVLIQDGDLEYSVDDYPLLLEPLAKKHTDLVLGSRHLSAGNWKIRAFETQKARAALLNLGGMFFHGLFNWTYGTELTDPTTMYKVFRKNLLKNLFLESDRFEFDYELLGKLIRVGALPLEVPVSYASRSFEEGKKVRILQDPLRWVWAILKYRWGRLYQQRPLSDRNRE